MVAKMKRELTKAPGRFSHRLCGAGVVDQHVDARLAFGDRRSDLACLGHAREIRQMHAMAESGRFRLEFPHRLLRPRFVAGDENDASALARERKGRDFAEARGPRNSGAFTTWQLGPHMSKQLERLSRCIAPRTS
jgi:hypothetical protein